MIGNFSKHWLFFLVLTGGFMRPMAGNALNTGLPGSAKTITGKVTSAVDGTLLPGVNVLVKGTSRGTTTNTDGAYSITVDSGREVLVFSYIGFQTQELMVGNASMIDVKLEESVENLQEAVVTALGIKREERSLGYSVGKVNGPDLTRVVNENVLTGMAGKVAGVTISSTGGTGSSVSMVIRGANSLNNDNQPLFVVDGVPLANTLNNVSQVNGNDNRVDYGNAISSLNPNDIENITILKGPSAAALYGSRAGNGVVLITTKTGANVNKLTVNVSSSVVFDKPYAFLKQHNRFGAGLLSYQPASVSNNPATNPENRLVFDYMGTAFGAELDKGYEEVQWNSPFDANGKQIKTPLVSHPDNAKNFFQTGITFQNAVSVANNNGISSYRLSLSNMRHTGIIPNSDLNNTTVNLNTILNLSKKFRISTNIDLSRNGARNRPAGERGANPMQWAYEVNSSTDIRDLRDYWMPGKEGLQQRTQDWDQKNKTYNNPYFLAYEINNGFTRDRVFGNIKADWQILPDLSLMLRYALDNLADKRETKLGTSYTGDPYGGYGLMNINSFENNADFLLHYKKNLKDFSLNVSGGGNHRYYQGFNANQSSINGLISPGVYTLNNIATGNLVANSSSSRKAVNSLYGIVNVGYRNSIFMEVTGRNDWSSTLPGAQGYFYPAASLSMLLNEMLPLSKNISLLKLRGGIAEVGNDTSPYQLIASLNNAGTFNGIPQQSTSPILLNPQLKPEIARSYEIGLDYQMFGNRLRFNGTYYRVDNKNQIFNTKMPPSSGYTEKNINAGLLRSKGIELTLGLTPVKSESWTWDINMNLTRNRTTLVELSDNLPYFVMWNEARGGSWTYVGEQMGDIYDAKLVTVEDPNSPYYGYPVLDRTGKWQAIGAENTRNKVGNYNPKFIFGAQTSIRYKGFNLALSFDWRNGGDFVSQTYRYSEEHGRSQLFLDKMINPGSLSGRELRDHLVANQDEMIRSSGNNFPIVGGHGPYDNGYAFAYGPYRLPYGGVFIPGVREVGKNPDGTPEYVENLGEDIGSKTLTLPVALATTWSFARASLFDASYLKLREVALSYDVPGRYTQKIGISNINIGVFSRNIILWTAAKINIDPERAFQPSTSARGGTQFMQGVERYNVTPWVAPIGFKVNLTL
ncbi:SusC/RagA family TonB-linked outer membrane protein [Ravibacter arvi]